MKISLFISAALFSFGIWYGASSDTLRIMLQNQLDSLGTMAEQLSTMENAQFWTGVFIFFNNAIKSFMVMYLGLFFGIIPVFFLVMNGMIIGYLLSSLHEQGINVFELVLRGLLPHGILEIPAILIASAYGLKLGGIAMQWISGRQGGARLLKHKLRMTLPLMLVLTVVLLVAAIVESTVTVWLLHE